MCLVVVVGCKFLERPGRQGQAGFDARYSNLRRKMTGWLIDWGISDGIGDRRDNKQLL